MVLSSKCTIKRFTSAPDPLARFRGCWAPRGKVRDGEEMEKKGRRGEGRAVEGKGHPSPFFCKKIATSDYSCNKWQLVSLKHHGIIADMD